MDQTRRGRATELELRRFHDLVDLLPHASSEPQKPFVESLNVGAALTVDSLTSSDSSVINQCCSTLATILNEVTEIRANAAKKFFPPLLLYDSCAPEADISDQCRPIQSMSNFFSVLLDLSKFLSRVVLLFRNLLLQIRCFHNLDKSILPDAFDRKLFRSWFGLGDLLAIFLQIDKIIESRPAIRNDWNIYCRTIGTAQHNPAQFEVSGDEIRSLIAAIATIEEQVMAGNGLRNCYEQSYGEIDNDKYFASRMRAVIVEMYNQWEKAAEVDIPDKHRLMVIISLFVFFHLHFPTNDAKLPKLIWKSHKKVVAFHLVGDILWIPCEFLMREIPSIVSAVDKKSIEFIRHLRKTFYVDHCDGMLEEAVSHITTANEWQFKVRSEVHHSASPDAATSLMLAEMILKGARIAGIMSDLLRNVLNSYTGPIQISKAKAYMIFNVVEKIKAISTTFAECRRVLLDCCQMACQQWRCHSLELIDRAKLSARESGDAHRAAAFQIAIQCLLGSESRTRLCVCGVALELAQYKDSMRRVDSLQLDALLTRLGTFCKIDSIIERVTDCSFLLFHRDLINIYWDTLLDRLPSRQSITHFTMAISDSIRYANKCRKENQMEHFRDEMVEAIERGFLFPLCADIENDLRVLSHQHLVVNERDKSPQEKLDFYKMIISEPEFRLFGLVINATDFITCRLQKTFYDLTAVNLRDRQAYSKMATLAKQRYGLDLIDGSLPICTVGQSLNVVKVICSLGDFVTTFDYCLHQQVFIEKLSWNRSLRVLTSEHMADSMRTFGLGVLNTSLNITYQLLRSKFAVLNQFLRNEHVHAQLQKDIRYFREHLESLKKLYPLVRAEQFNRAFSKFGAQEGESTYMDRLRILVTQMGNALGFVRSMSSASAAVASQMKAYDTVQSEIGITETEGNTPLHTLKELLTELNEQANKTKDFTKLLVEIFRRAFFDDTKYAYLLDFYVAVPALTVNYVEHMLVCRDRLKKRAQHNKETTFTDDGFIMGLAYILTVLNLWPQFSSLNWFRSITKKCMVDYEGITEEMKSSKDSRNVHLKAARLQAFEREFKLLSYTFQSARVFFSFDEDK